MRAGGAAAAIAAGTAVLAILVGSYHLALSNWIEASGRLLGALHHRHAVPFYSNWHTTLGWRVVPAAATLAVCLLLLRRATSRRTSSLALLALAVATVPAVGISVASIDPPVVTELGTLPAFQSGFANRALEYYGDVRKVDKRGGPVNFLKLFARPEFHDRLSLHSGTHPPGPILFLWGVAQVGGPGPLPAALAAIGFTALGLIPAFLLARDLAGEETARLALVLMLLAPAAVLFTTTSMDGPFGVFPIAAVWAFHRALATPAVSRLAAWAGLAGLCVALGMLMSYVTLFACLYFALALGLSLARSRISLGRAATVTAASFAAFSALYALIAASTGFRPVAALCLAIERDATMMGTGYESPARYLQISFANLAAFLIGVGLPTVLVWGRQLSRTLRRRARAGRLDVFTAAFAAALVVISFSTLFTLETERIWIGMIPFLAIPAARLLEILRRLEARATTFWTVTSLLSAQILIFESFLNTRW